MKELVKSLNKRIFISPDEIDGIWIETNFLHDEAGLNKYIKENNLSISDLKIVPRIEWIDSNMGFTW